MGSNCPIRLFVTLTVVLASSVLGAPTAGGGAGAATAPAAGGEDAEHQALRRLVALYEQAADQGKPDLLQPCLDPEFSGVMVTGSEVTSFASLQDYWRRIKKLIGEEGKYHVQITVAAPALLSGDLAVAHGTTADEVTTSTGKVFRYEGRWTAICRKRDGQWKVYRVHGSMDPVENAFVAATVRWTAGVWGVGAGVAGLVLGWALHWLLSRRRGTGAAA